MNDAQLVDDAYQQAVKQHVDNYIAAWIDRTPNRDEHFCAGLRDIREAKARALQLLFQVPLVGE